MWEEAGSQGTAEGLRVQIRAFRNDPNRNLTQRTQCWVDRWVTRLVGRVALKGLGKGPRRGGTRTSAPPPRVKAARPRGYSFVKVSDLR